MLLFILSLNRCPSKTKITKVVSVIHNSKSKDTKNEHPTRITETKNTQGAKQLNERRTPLKTGSMDHVHR